MCCAWRGIRRLPWSQGLCKTGARWHSGRSGLVTDRPRRALPQSLARQDHFTRCVALDEARRVLAWLARPDFSQQAVADVRDSVKART